VIYADGTATTPVEAPPVTLPWITGSPHSLYARVRAITAHGATPWSAGFGFDMVPPSAPAPLPSYPGLLRWTTVDGALGYQITLDGTASDVYSDGSAGSPSHRLMPAFLWSGDQALDGTSAELFRVYVFTDRQCLNRVFTSAVVGSPAYAPRAFGALKLPGTAG